jgi:hypothetical protein
MWRTVTLFLHIENLNQILSRGNAIDVIPDLSGISVIFLFSPRWALTIFRVILTIKCLYMLNWLLFHTGLWLFNNIFGIFKFIFIGCLLKHGQRLSGLGGLRVIPGFLADGWESTSRPDVTWQY